MRPRLLPLLAACLLPVAARAADRPLEFRVTFDKAVSAKPFTGRPLFWFMNDILSYDHFNRWLIRFLILLSRFTADHVVFNSNASLDATPSATRSSRMKAGTLAQGSAA